MIKGSTVSKWIIGLGLGYAVSQVFKPKATDPAAETKQAAAPRQPRKIYSGGTNLQQKIVAARKSYNAISSI